MKKLFVILICISILLLCAACSDSQSGQTDSSQSSATAASASQSPSPAAAPEENAADFKDELSAGGSADAQNAGNNTEESADDETNSKVLVAYFSATGTTEGVAEKIAEAAGADLYEIVPAQPYTQEDLNYNSDSSRTTEEQNDSSARPEISGEVPGWDNYDTVYLGYPIWWGEAPRIMDTFAQSYSFDGKTIIPFCTSGSSGIGSSSVNLAILADGGNWLSGTRFNGGVSEQEIEEWFKGLEIN